MDTALTDLRQAERADAYAYQAQIEAAEAERAKPQPILTPCLLIAFALAVYAVNLAVFGTGSW